MEGDMDFHRNNRKIQRFARFKGALGESAERVAVKRQKISHRKGGCLFLIRSLVLQRPDSGRRSQATRYGVVNGLQRQFSFVKYPSAGVFLMPLSCLLVSYFSVLFFVSPCRAFQLNSSQLSQTVPALDLRHKPVHSMEVLTYFKQYRLDFSNVLHYFGHFDSAGFRVAGHVFVPRKSKGTVLFLHGYLDHTGLAAKLIGFLLEQGYGVATFDLPGHGLSSGDRADVEDFSQYVFVLEHFLKKIQPHIVRPLHFTGHSTGCAIAFEFLHKIQKPVFDKVVFLAPLIHSAHWFKAKAGYYLAKPFAEFVPRQFRRNSSDEAYLKFVKRDPLRIDKIPLRWVRALFSWNERIERYNRMVLSVCIIQGTDDTVVDWRYNTTFLKEKIADVSLTYVKGAKHNVINERSDLRESVYHAIGVYLAGGEGVVHK